MKKNTTLKTTSLIIALSLIVYNLSAQNGKINKTGVTEADNLIDDLYKIDNATIAANVQPDNRIVSKRGLNNFFAKKVGYYLSGEENSSLNKNYLFLNSEDSKLVFGHNNFFQASNERVLNVTTIGFKADLSETFAEIAKSQNVTGNMGLNFKWTHYFSGSVHYDDTYEQHQGKKALAAAAKTQKCTISDRRRKALNDLAIEIKQKTEDCEKSVVKLRDDKNQFCDDIEAVIKEKKDEFYDNLRKTYLAKYAELESELLDEDDVKNLIRVGWFSVTGYAPFTPKTYFNIEDISQLPSEKKGYLAELNFNYSYLLEFRKAGRMFFNAGLGFASNNSINGEKLVKYNISELKAFGVTNDSVYKNDKDGDVYLGTYKDYGSGSLSFQAVIFPKASGKKLSKFFTGDWGFSAKWLYTSDTHTDKTTIQLGLPFILKGKDEDHPVNFELQFRFNDTARWTNESKDFSMGISVGLPFSSIIY